MSDIQVYKKNHREKTNNPSMEVYVNKIEVRITFEIKTRYNLNLNLNLNEITWKH